MIINFNDYKFRYTDMSIIAIEQLELSVRESIIKDDGLMLEINATCEEEMREFPDSKLTLKERVDLKIDEIIDNALSKVKIYCDFSIEVKL